MALPNGGEAQNVWIVGVGGQTPNLGEPQNVFLTGPQFGGGVVTYREGATTDPSHALYGSWPEAYAAASQVRPSTIFIDGSYGSQTIPAGTWDIHNITLSGGYGFSGVLSMENGTLFTGVALNFFNIILNQNGSSPFIRVTGSDTSFVTFDGGSAVQCLGSVPAISVEDTAFTVLYVRYFGFLYGNPGPVVTTSVNATTWIFTDIATSISDNTLDGDGGYQVGDLTGIAATNRNPNISHIQLASNIVYQYG